LWDGDYHIRLRYGMGRVLHATEELHATPEWTLRRELCAPKRQTKVTRQTRRKVLVSEYNYYLTGEVHAGVDTLTPWLGTPNWK